MSLASLAARCPSCLLLAACCGRGCGGWRYGLPQQEKETETASQIGKRQSNAFFFLVAFLPHPPILVRRSTALSIFASSSSFPPSSPSVLALTVPNAASLHPDATVHTYTQPSPLIRRSCTTALLGWQQWAAFPPRSRPRPGRRIQA